MTPLPLDSCEVTVLVDNMMDILSTTPSYVTSETANVRKAGATVRQLCACKCDGCGVCLAAY